MIHLFTDGSCQYPKPIRGRTEAGGLGYGGWSFLYQLDRFTKVEERGSVENTTSQRMELLAVINGLKSLQRRGLERCRIKLVTDCKNIEVGLEKLEAWKASGWVGFRGQALADQDYWQELDRLRGLFKLRCSHVGRNDGVLENKKVDQASRHSAKALRRGLLLSSMS